MTDSTDNPDRKPPGLQNLLGALGMPTLKPVDATETSQTRDTAEILKIPVAKIVQNTTKGLQKKDGTEESETSDPGITYIRAAQRGRREIESPLIQTILDSIEEIRSSYTQPAGETHVQGGRYTGTTPAETLQAYNNILENVQRLEDELRRKGLPVDAEQPHLLQRIAVLEEELAERLPPDEVQMLIAEARLDGKRQAEKAYKDMTKKYARLEDFFNAHFGAPAAVKVTLLEEFGTDYFQRLNAALEKAKDK